MLALPDTTDCARWQIAFRLGIAPYLPTKGLRVLAAELTAAIAGQPHRLCQRATVLPLAGGHTGPFPSPERACAAALCGWQGDSLSDVAEVSGYFLGLRDSADRLLADLDDPPLAYFADFTGFWDREPAAVVYPAVLIEVQHVLADREVAA